MSKPLHRYAFRLSWVLFAVWGGVLDVNADPPVAPVQIKPGENLFGEQIGPQINESGASQVSQNEKRVLALIDRTLELTLKQSDIESNFRRLMTQLDEKSKLIEQIPNRYQTAVAQFALGDEKRVSLSPALNFPPNNPQYQEYFRIKTQLQSLAGEIALMEQQSKVLPVEVRNLKSELEILNRTRFKTEHDSLTLLSGWLETLNTLVYVPEDDAEKIASACQLKLDQYPGSHLIRLAFAYSRLHQNQPLAAATELRTVYNATTNYRDSVSQNMRLRCLVGIGFAEIEQQNLDAAAAALGEARKLSPKDYEVTVLLAHLADLRGKAPTAFSIYKNATSIAPKRPDAFRWAAEMTVKTSVRPPEIALSLAQRACELDEVNDFRNSLALARAYHACGKLTERDDAIAEAYDHAGDSGKSIVETVAKELQLVAPPSDAD